MQSVDDRIHKPQVGVADIWDEFRADGAVDVPIPVPKIRVHVQIEQVGRFGTWVLGRPIVQVHSLKAGRTADTPVRFETGRQLARRIVHWHARDVREQPLLDVAHLSLQDLQRI
jgi:hypothetical protein